MQYIIVDRAKARDYGFEEDGRAVRETKTVLNEMEVMASPALSGTLEERACMLQGSVVTYQEAINIMIY